MTPIAIEAPVLGGPESVRDCVFTAVFVHSSSMTPNRDPWRPELLSGNI